MKNRAYSSFTRHGNKLVANQDVGEYMTKIPSGIYTPHVDMQRGIFWLQDSNILSDEILNLPSKEYQQVVSEMNSFLTPEKRQLFKDHGYVYKRSALLHGAPGTGKTCIVQRLVSDVLKRQGIVLYVDDPRVLEYAYGVLSDVAPNTFTMVVFEEFDRMAERYENALLSLLDGEVQKDNVIYLATTNYIEKIPARLRRPGRFSSVIEVKYPSKQARLAYLNHKLSNKALAKDLAGKTKGLSVDELKEVIQAVVILDQPLEYVLGRITANRSLETQTNENDECDEYFEGTDFEDDSVSAN